MEPSKHYQVKPSSEGFLSIMDIITHDAATAKMMSSRINAMLSYKSAYGDDARVQIGYLRVMDDYGFIAIEIKHATPSVGILWGKGFYVSAKASRTFTQRIHACEISYDDLTHLDQMVRLAIL